ncbi:MAG: hypothetical protein CMJ32_01255 [Phycisphaerae bacterium]|nr:hypothetical protein [Phycisphaerae bacterium]
MKRTIKFVSTLSLVTLALGLGHMHSLSAGDARGGGDEEGGLIGADVIVGSLNGITRWSSSLGVTSYSIGTTSCNIGDEELSWVAGTNVHPVIPQNIYRWENGQLHQIGMSHCKHGFCALQENLCGPCTPSGGGCDDALGIGCSDPYSSFLNGEQGGLGPRSPVTPHTGHFPYPFSSAPVINGLSRRLQVENEDLNPTLHPDALYFGEGIYVHVEDATAGNDDNNTSLREISVGSFTSGGYNLSLTGPTLQMINPAELVKQLDEDAFLTHVDVRNSGRFSVAVTVRDNPDGTYRYTYHLYNQTVHRNIRSLSIDKSGLNLSNIGHNLEPHHSGEPYDTDTWSMTEGSDSILWTTESWFTNPLANALRWGMLNTFWFDSTAPPVSGDITVGLHTAGGFLTFEAIVPETAVPSLPGDLNGDCVVDGQDLGALLGAWGTPDGDLTGDQTTNGEDLGALLGAWGDSC